MSDSPKARLAWLSSLIAFICLFNTGCGGPAGQPNTPDANRFLLVVLLSDLILLGIPVAVSLAVWRWRYRRRWYYRREGAEVGTFSDNQLDQLYKAGKIEPATPVRQVRDSEWCQGVVLEYPPKRFWRGVRYALYAGLPAFFVSYALFGKVQGLDFQGRYIGFDSVCFSPDANEFRRLSGLNDSQLLQLGFTWGAATLIPNAGGFADRIASGEAQFIERVENARTRILTAAGLCFVLGACGGAFTAQQQARIHKGRRVSFKKQRGASPASSETETE